MNPRPALSRLSRPSMNPRPALSRLWRRLWILVLPCHGYGGVCESLSCPVVAIEAICELLPCFELATEAINEPSFAHVTAYKLLSCPESTEEAGCELPVPSVTTEGVMGELPDCCVAPLGAVCELLTLPVMNSETINAPHVCPVSTYESEFACSVVTNTLDLEVSVCPVLTRESVFELSVLPVSVTKLSTPA